MNRFAGFRLRLSMDRLLHRVFRIEATDPAFPRLDDFAEAHPGILQMSEGQRAVGEHLGQVRKAERRWGKVGPANGRPECFELALVF